MLLVQCDFDETITIGYVSTAIREAFAPGIRGALEKVEKDYLSGRYSVEESNIRQFARVNAGSKEEVERFVLDQVVIRHGFEKFVEYCRRSGIELIIVSSGLDLYISPTLKKLGLDHLEMHSGEATVTPSGIEIEYTDPSGAVITRGFKESYLRHFKKQDKTVIYIGDGQSDIVPAREADFVIARSNLEEHFRSNNLPYFGFETFEDVARHVEGIRQGLTGKG